MITYEDLKKANDSIVTTDIKGKDYAEVNQRIKAFRMVYPTGFIRTEVLSNENGICVFSAQVGYHGENGVKVLLGTGTAYEKENSTFINKTSYIENCETSAVGRALGMAGFGIDTSVASYEEVQTAIINQQDKPKKEMEYTKPKSVKDELMEQLKEILIYKGVNPKDFAKENGLKSSSSEDFIKELINKAGLL